MMDLYKLLGRLPVMVRDSTEWAVWFDAASESGARIVKQEQVGIFECSTVFLGLDHNFSGHGDALLFETMVFDGALALWCERCTTWGQAEFMHQRGVAWACEKMSSVGNASLR